MVSGFLLSALAVVYLLVLFGVAFYGERRSVYPGHARLRPWIYSLALGVYCTTWTFFGAVGTAVRDGWAYLPIYLGPVLVFLFATPFLERLVAIVRAHNITSIADLISSRFGKSPALAALVAIIALTAGVPYLALQYKAVGTSIDVLTGAGGSHPAWYADTALWVALMMAAFAILFGTRRLDATEHHEGVMLAIAFESVVKLVAFAAVGLFALTHMDNAPSLAATPLGEAASVFSGDFVVTTALAAAAIFCLPRQFLVGIVECADQRDVRTARLVFTGYLAVFTVLVVPIVLSGLGTGVATSHQPDSLVLTLPLLRDAPALAVIAFLGGLSAATAMVIVSSIALATMITNDLVMPTLWRGRWLKTTEGSDIGRIVLWLRRAAILSLALLAYAYHRNTVAPASLASIGLLAFAAVAQFAPAILAGLYWRRATRTAVFWGLAAGFALWAYGLLLPNFTDGAANAGSGTLQPAARLIEWLGFVRLSPLVRRRAAGAGRQCTGAGGGLAVRWHLAARTHGGDPVRASGPAAGGRRRPHQRPRRRRAGDRRAHRRHRRGRSRPARALAADPAPAASRHRSRRPRPDAAHGARAGRSDRRLLGAPDVHARAARPRPRRGGSGGTAGRNLAGTALQPPAAAGDDGERLAGHLGGRQRRPPRRLERPLPGDVRLPGRHGAHRQPGRRPDPLERAAGRVWRNRIRTSRSASGSRTCAPARPT